MPALACLVVEDSPMMRQLIVFALSRLPGIAITEVDDGIAALPRLARERYDLLITDVNMPVMDGLKLIRRVRAEARHAGTKIIVVTTEGADEDRNRALSLGADAYITKPIQAAQLLETIGQLFPE